MGARGELRLDVSSYVDLPGPLQTAATVYLPDAVGRQPLILFLFPGGGYSRGYYAIDRPELPGPGQADFHREQGAIVVACDHLGVGDSSLPDPDALTFARLAAANHGTVQAVLAMLAGGQVDPALPAVVDPFVVGVGQSMGGCLGVVQQAQHSTFRALAVLGYSGTHMNMRQPPPGQDMLRYLFHWDEEPDSLVDADLGGLAQPWRSTTMPSCVPSMAGSGLIVNEAATVGVPLFLAAGERDVIDDLYTEPAAFGSSPDITLYLLRRSAHMHNFAPTRMLLWERLHHWADSLRTMATSPES